MVKQAHKRAELVKLPSGGTGRSSKNLATKPGHQHVHPPRGRALLPVGTTGVPPRAKMHPRLEPATPMSHHTRQVHYDRQHGCQPGGTCTPLLTGPQTRRLRKKLNRQLRKRTAEPHRRRRG